MKRSYKERIIQVQFEIYISEKNIPGIMEKNDIHCMSKLQNMELYN
jgi:hypothetical protein